MSIKKFGPLFGIIVLTIIVFFPSLSGGYLLTYDDNLQIVNNPDVLNLSWQSFKNYFTTYYVRSYQPLASLSFGLEYYFFGLNPMVPHITNLVLHLLNIVVVSILLTNLTPHLKTLNIFIVAVFAIHPLQGELLGWISTRSTLIVSFFMLLSILYYVKYVKSDIKHNSYFWYSLVFFVLSLFSKPSGIILPFILLLIDYLYRRRMSVKLFVEKIPFFIGLFVIGVVSLISRKIYKAPVEEIATQGYSEYYNLYEKISIASQSIFLYLKKSFFPNDLFIYYGYPYRIGENATIGFSFLIAPLLMLVISILCWLVYRRFSNEDNRIWIFGLGFFLVNIFLVINIVSFSATFFNERYMYVSILGVFIAVAVLIHSIIKNTPLLKYAFFTIFAIFLFQLGSISNERASLWKSDLTLWTHVEKFKGQSSQPYRVLGKIYANNKDYNKAVAYYNNGIKKNPYSIDLYYWRSFSIAELGDFNYALTDLNRVISSKNELKGAAFYQKSLIFKKLNLLDSARINLDSAKVYNVEKALFEDNNSLNANNIQQIERATLQRIDSFIKLKKYDKALDNYETLSLLVTNNLSYQIEKGKLESQLQKWNASIKTFSKVIETNPNHKIARLNRAYAFFITQKHEESIKDYSYVLTTLKENSGEIYYYRALVYIVNKEYAKACNDLQAAKSKGYKVPLETENKACK